MNNDRIAKGNGWILYNDDCVKALSKFPDNSIDYVNYSVPFSSLYVYSNSVHDMGNVRSHKEFFEGYQFLVKELLRIVKPGRLVSVHSMILPTSKERDGFIGLYEFPDDIRDCHKSEGFIFHSEVVIKKDPVTAMQRTKALGLLHKQLVKDSSMSRQGIPDYVTTFRKPGDNKEPIAGRFEYYAGADWNKPIPEANAVRDSINIWQRYADPTWADVTSNFERILPTLTPEQAEVFFQILNHQPAVNQGIWEDINQTEVLKYQNAKAPEDERHIAPLQLQVIERCLQMWSNPGDVVLDPFNGIGSCGHVALKMGRKYIGVELKRSYFEMATNNLRAAAGDDSQQLNILDLLAV